MSKSSGIVEKRVRVTDSVRAKRIASRNITDGDIVIKNRVKVYVKQWKPPSWAQKVPKKVLQYLKLPPDFGTYSDWQYIGEFPNLITNNGRDNIHNASLRTSTQPLGLQWMAISTGTNAPAAGDSTLEGELTTPTGVSRSSATYSHTAGNSSSTLQFTYTNNGASISGISKAATFNSSSSGTMGFENTFTSVTLASNDQLSLTWTQNIS